MPLMQFSAPPPRWLEGRRKGREGCCPPPITDPHPTLLPALVGRQLLNLGWASGLRWVSQPVQLPTVLPVGEGEERGGRSASNPSAFSRPQGFWGSLSRDMGRRCQQGNSIK